MLQATENIRKHQKDENKTIKSILAYINTVSFLPSAKTWSQSAYIIMLLALVLTGITSQRPDFLPINWKAGKLFQ